jgi:hypothetical protein
VSGEWWIGQYLDWFTFAPADSKDWNYLRLPIITLKRKARESNPHALAGARFSKPARLTVSGCPPGSCRPRTRTETPAL